MRVNNDADTPDGDEGDDKRKMPGIDVNPGRERQDKGLKPQPGKLPGEKASGADTAGHG